MGAGLSSMGPLSSSLPPLPPSRSLTSGPLLMPRELEWQQDKACSPCVDSPPLAMGFPFPHATAIVNLPTYITSPVPLTLTGEAISVPTGQYIGMYPALPVAGYVGASYQEGGNIRTMQSRPKPRCWEHGCKGRQFSSYSNLSRHQREKSGLTVKASCPWCGITFTRTTARDKHMLDGICTRD
jgi:hypothetical protein